MLNKVALAGALILGTASAALAGGNSGEYSGGFVMPGSMDGVNPAYHPRWLPNYAKAHDYGNGGNAYGYAKRGRAHRYTNGGSAYGYANEGSSYGPLNGEFINGNFIPRGTSPAQVPAYREDDY
jgi:hypothetical protein